MNEWHQVTYLKNCRTLCGCLYLCLGNNCQAGKSNWGQTFCSPAALRPNKLGSAEKATDFSGLYHCCSPQSDLLQSFHSLSNYMKLLLCYCLSEPPVGLIRAYLSAVSSVWEMIQSEKGAWICTNKWRSYKLVWKPAGNMHVKSSVSAGRHDL